MTFLAIIAQFSAVYIGMTICAPGEGFNLKLQIGRILTDGAIFNDLVALLAFYVLMAAG